MHVPSALVQPDGSTDSDYPGLLSSLVKSALLLLLSMSSCNPSCPVAARHDRERERERTTTHVFQPWRALREVPVGLSGVEPRASCLESGVHTTKGFVSKPGKFNAVAKKSVLMRLRRHQHNCYLRCPLTSGACAHLDRSQSLDIQTRRHVQCLVKRVSCQSSETKMLRSAVLIGSMYAVSFESALTRPKSAHARENITPMAVDTWQTFANIGTTSLEVGEH